MPLHCVERKFSSTEWKGQIQNLDNISIDFKLLIFFILGLLLHSRGKCHAPFESLKYLYWREEFLRDKVSTVWKMRGRFRFKIIQLIKLKKFMCSRAPLRGEHSFACSCTFYVVEVLIAKQSYWWRSDRKYYFKNENEIMFY